MNKIVFFLFGITTICLSQNKDFSISWEIGNSPIYGYRYNIAFTSENFVYTLGGDNQGSFERYNSLNQTWEKRSPIPEELIFPSGAIMNNYIYVIGGIDSLKNYSSKVYKYSIEKDQWSRCGNLPIPITRSAASAFNNKLYVFGGLTGKRDKFSKNTSSVYEYDPNTNIWTKTTEMPVAKHGHASISTEDFIIVVGGYGTTEKAFGISNAVWAYDPGKNTWQILESMPSARGFLGLAKIDTFVFAIGGRIPGDSSPVEYYDLRDKSWHTLEAIPLNIQRFGISSINKIIFMIGDELNQNRMIIGKVN